MTTITPSRARRRHPPGARRAARAAFTLVEVLISSTLASFILAGIVSTFLFLGRSGANIQNYNDMESQARRALEQFAQDTRQASAITWKGAQTVTLTVDGKSTSVSWNTAEALEIIVDSKPVTYMYANGSLLRTGAIPDTTTYVTRTILSGITSFSFKAYTITGSPINGIGTATTLLSAGQTTKQLQISLQASRSSTTVSTATNTVLSARFILRNKRVTA